MSNTPTLYSFGCSLTKDNWPSNLAKNIGFSCINAAVGAGDNLTQIKRFTDLFLNDSISENDYVIWEITYLNRLGFRLSPDHHFYIKNKDNNIDSHSRIKKRTHIFLSSILKPKNENEL